MKRFTLVLLVLLFATSVYGHGVGPGLIRVRETDGDPIGWVKQIQVDNNALTVSGTDATLDLSGAAGGQAITFDIGDDAGNDSVDVGEIATTGDTNTIFTQPTADKILIAVGNNWPTADSADAVAADAVTDLGIDWGTGANQVSGADIPLDVTNFDGLLGAGDADVQTALETIDDGGAGTLNTIGAPTGAWAITLQDTETVTWTTETTASDAVTIAATGILSDISVFRLDQNTGNATDGTMLEISTDDAQVDHILLMVGAADYVTHKIIDAGTYTIDVTSDGTAAISMPDPVSMGSTLAVTGGIIGSSSLNIGPITATGTSTFQTAISPAAAGAGTIGSATAEWAHLYLHDSAVIYAEADQSNTLTSSATGWTANLAFTFDGAIVANGDSITSDGVLVINATSAVSFSDEAITNVSDIAVDSISADGTNVLFGAAAATQLQIRDTAIYIASLNDRYLDLEADGGIRINGPLTFANEGEIALPSSDAGPDTTGEIRHDSTITNLATGALAWYDGDEIRYLVDLDAFDFTDTYVIAYSAANDNFYMKADADSGGAPVLNSVANPEAAWTPTLGDTETVTWTTEQNTAASVFVIDNSVADVTNNVYLLELQYSDDGQANADYLKIVDNNTDVWLTIQEEGKLSIGADPGDSGILNLANAAIISWEDATETTLTHVDNTGLATNLQFQAATLTDGTASLTGGALTGLTTPLTVAQGGMGAATFTDGGLLVGAAAGAVEALAVGLTTEILVGGGAGTNPAWGTDLPTAVTIGTGYIYRAGGTDVADADVADDITIDLATLATTVTVTDNEATAEANAITFVAGADLDGGNVGLESDGNLTYNPSTGTVAATIFSGAIAPSAATTTAGQIGYTASAYNLYANSDSLTITNAANVWTFDSTGDTIAFTPAVAFTSYSIPASASPGWTFNDSDAGLGAATLGVDANTASQDSQLIFKVDDSAGDVTGGDTTYMTIDGQAEQITFAKKIDVTGTITSSGLITSNGGTTSLTPVAGASAAFLSTFTGANLYGGTYVATSDSGDAVLPVMAAGMNFCIITAGAIQVVVATNAADGYLLDGTDTAEDNSVVNGSTAGDIACFQYYTADDWLITTNGWTTE